MQRTNAKSREELELELCLKPGKYPFEINSADEKKSGAGNDMFALDITVYDNDNKPRKMKAWVGTWNDLDLLNFMECIGLGPEWSADTVTANMLLGRSGYCKTTITKPKPDSDYGPQVKVSKWIALVDGEVAPVIVPSEPVAAGAPLSDDDIPF